jgi:hypothetical protein
VGEPAPVGAAPTPEAAPGSFADVGAPTGEFAGAGTAPELAVASFNTALPVIGDRAPIGAFLNPRRLARRQAGNNGGPTPNPYDPLPPIETSIPAQKASLKISDNQTPLPITRFYFTYDFFNNVNAPFNERLGLNLRDVRIHHYTFGYEQAFLQNRLSVGLRLPYNVMTYEETSPERPRSVNTDQLGDLSVYTKFLLWNTPDYQNFLSTGLLVVTPTGPRNFAGSDVFFVNSTTYLDPFVGYRFQLGDRAYVTGFTSLDIPTNGEGPLYLFNDFQFGYYLYRAATSDDFLTAIVPIFEVHVNTPLSNRGFSESEPFFGIDTVSLMGGLHVSLWDRCVISWSAGAPVTGPRPWDFETLVLLNVLFGPRPAQAPPGTFGIPTF